MRFTTDAVLIVCSAGAMLAAAPLAAQATVDYSLDNPSPETPAPWCESDLVESSGAFVRAPKAFFGLVAADEIDALSDGHDSLPLGPWGCTDANANCIPDVLEVPPAPGLPPPKAATQTFYYSVSRSSVGAGTVLGQSSTNGAAGDKFFVAFVIGDFNGNCIGDFPVPCPPGGLPPGFKGVFLPPGLDCDAPVCGLTPLPGESNIDALDLGGPFAVRLAYPAGSLNSPGVPSLFSLAPGSPTLAGLGAGPADILQGAGGTNGIYATAAALGLQTGDDIDALAAWDGPPVGVLSANDVLYVSLTPGSPTLTALGASAADVLDITPGIGNPSVAINAAVFDLLSTDDLDALTCVDPGDPNLKSTGPIPSASYCTTNVAVLSDGGGTQTPPPGFGPLVGDPAEPYRVCLDCSGAPGPGLYVVLLRPGLIPGGVATAYGLLCASGPNLAKFTGFHNLNVVCTPSIPLPFDLNFCGLSYTDQGVCLSGAAGILSNALRETLGVR